MGKRIDNCIECERYVTISARDMCHTCYMRWYRQQPGVREKIREGDRRRYSENPEKYNERTARYRSTIRGKELKRQYDRQYYLENGERIRRLSKQWKKDHPEQSVEQCRIYQARKAQCEANLTLEEWDVLLEVFGNRCAYCGVSGVELDKEHVIPASLGGDYAIYNIVPACKRCNSRKGTMMGEEFCALLDKEERVGLYFES